MTQLRTLHLGWTCRRPHQPSLWHHIGTFSHNPGSPMTFRYAEGMAKAQAETGFLPLPEFPDPETIYATTGIFPLLSNRLMQPKRPDRPEYLRLLELTKDAHPFDIIAASGGRKLTDSLDLFQEPTQLPGGLLTQKFFLNRPPNPLPGTLRPGQTLLARTQPHPAEGQPPTVRLFDQYANHLGNLPQHLAARAKDADIQAHVLRINPPPAPLSLRLRLQATFLPGQTG